MFDFRTASVPKPPSHLLDASPRQELHTPPREDPATRPRTVLNPHDDLEHEHPHRTATRQALILTSTFFFVFMFVTTLGFGLYMLAGAVLGKQLFGACPEQPIENGMILTGPHNSTGKIRCNKGYSMSAPADVELRCMLIHEECVILQRATMQKPARRRCKRHYAYIKPESAIDPVDANESVWRPLRTEAYLETKGLCKLDALSQKESLFGGGAMPAVAAHLHPTWSPAASSASLLALALAAVAALVGAGVARGRDPGRGVEPDTAEELLLPPGEASPQAIEEAKLLRGLE